MSGTLGPDVIDIHELSKLGIFTYDPAFFSTASCMSEITFIDGDAGLLYYRGYPIEQLAKNSDFLESAICCWRAGCRMPRKRPSSCLN